MGVPHLAGFGKEGPFDRAPGHELVEWLGEIFRKICLLNYGLLRNSEKLTDRRIDLHTSSPPSLGREEGAGALIHFFHDGLQGLGISLFLS